MSMPGKRIFTISVVTVVAVAVIFGLVLIGSPAKERARRMDEKRVRDLSVNSMAVDRYWRLHNQKLPSSLNALSNQPGMVIRLRDPETGRPYEYRILSNDKYELCAVFRYNTAQEQQAYFNSSWAHGAGKQCFQRKVRGSR